MRKANLAAVAAGIFIGFIFGKAVAEFVRDRTETFEERQVALSEAPPIGVLGEMRAA